MSLRTACPRFFRLLPSSARLAAVRVLSFPVRVLVFPFRWWTWRMTRRLVFTGAVLLTLVALTYSVENWRGRHAFAAVVREAAAAGLSLDPSDHAQPPVPDDQNLAKIPLFDAPADKMLREQFWNEFKTRLHPLQKDGPARSLLPNHGRPDPFENRPADQSALRAGTHTLATENGTETPDVYSARIAPLLAELATAAAERPYLRYDFNWEDFSNYDAAPSELLHSLGQVFTLQALLDLDNNRPADAARALGVPLRLGAALRRDPTLLAQLVALAMDGQAQALIWQGQLAHRWTAAELDRFADLLADDHILTAFRRAYACETAVGVSHLLRLSGPLRNSDLISGSGSLDRSLRFLVDWAPSGWLLQNAAANARFYLDEVLPSIDPTSARVAPEKIIRRDEKSLRQRPYDFLARTLGSSAGLFVTQVGQDKSKRDLARLAVALEKHLLAHGAYPASLAPVLAADPTLAALHDPFDGLPYRYRRDADGGFTLWGVDQNLRDDGGVFPDKNGDRAHYDTDDLIWHVPGAAQTHAR